MAFGSAFAKLLHPYIGMHHVVFDFSAELAGNLCQGLEAALGQHVETDLLGAVEEEMAEQGEIVFSDGNFNQMAAMKLFCVPHESYCIRLTFTQFV